MTARAPEKLPRPNGGKLAEGLPLDQVQHRIAVLGPAEHQSRLRADAEELKRRRPGNALYPTRLAGEFRKRLRRAKDRPDRVLLGGGQCAHGQPDTGVNNKVPGFGHGTAGVKDRLGFPA